MATASSPAPPPPRYPLGGTSLHTVPHHYIWPQSLRPSASATLHGKHVPVIDLADLEGERRQEVVTAIGSACREWGFFQVVNHGVATSLMDSMLEVALQFFTSPAEDRMKYSTNDVNAPVRFGTSFNPLVDEVLSWRDFLRHQCLPISDYVGQWPDTPATYREIVSEYCTAVRSLALRLLSAISESLGLNSDFIEKAFEGQSQILLSNYYPPCPNPELALGIPAHSDGTGLTVLLQDEVQGLQVVHNGSWVNVDPLKNSFIVNMGDQLQILTNGRYESVEHRAVVNAERSRVSIATAYGPSLNTVIAPAAELVDEQHPPLYKPARYREYLESLNSKSLHGKAMVDSKKRLGQ